MLPGTALPHKNPWSDKVLREIRGSLSNIRAGKEVIIVKEAKSSWRYFIAKKYDHPDADKLLLPELVANGVIKTYKQFEPQRIFGFKDHERFPGGFVRESKGQAG